MAYINFDTLNMSIDPSLQVGDMLYYTSVTQAVSSPHTSASGIAGKPLPAGVVTSGPNPNISFADNLKAGVVHYTPNIMTYPLDGDFILFAKPTQVNESSLKGYYADVTFTNRSTKRAELFAVSSEIAISSK